MKAFQYHVYGGPEVLQRVDLPRPEAGPGQILIAVHAVGVNPSDWKRRAGLYRDDDPVSFPAGVGVEASGVVVQIGADVEQVAIGDAVFGCGINTLAEYAVLSHWAAKPENLSFAQAGGLPVICETAQRSLDGLDIKAGQTLLISGAAGGIGTAAIQFARQRSLTVIGTASPRNHDYLRSLGAIATAYGPGLGERVRALAPQGIDAALDVAGSGIIPELIDIVGDASRVLSVADFSATHLGAKFSAGPPKHLEQTLVSVARLCREGRFQLRIDRAFAFDQTAEAHRISAQGHVAGKLVIMVR